MAGELHAAVRLEPGVRGRPGRCGTGSERDADGDGTPGERLWPVQDANWNVTALVDGNGAVVERYAYTAFGQMSILSAFYGVQNWSSNEFDFGYQGMRYDSIGNLDLSRDRTGYSPSLGFWTTLDPINFGGGDLRLNGFVHIDPINMVDPSGLDGEPAAKMKPGWFTSQYYLSLDMSNDPVLGKPLSTDSVKTWEEVLQAVKKKSGGPNCNACVKLIRVGGHGEMGDFHGLGANETTVPGSDLNYYWIERYKQKQKDHDAVAAGKVLDILKEIKSHMCEGGKIEFISCGLFKGNVGGGGGGGVN